MSTHLKPILCETESDSNAVHYESKNITIQPTNTTQLQGNDLIVSSHQKIFRHSDVTIVPDFSDIQSISSIENRWSDMSCHYGWACF